MFRSFSVFIDGELVGRIKNGAEVAFCSTQGRRFVHVELDGDASQKVEVFLGPGQEVRLYCGTDLASVGEPLYLGLERARVDSDLGQITCPFCSSELEARELGINKVLICIHCRNRLKVLSGGTTRPATPLELPDPGLTAKLFFDRAMKPNWIQITVPITVCIAVGLLLSIAIYFLRR
jgi:hypothetical protein